MKKISHFKDLFWHVEPKGFILIFFICFEISLQMFWKAENSDYNVSFIFSK